MKRLALLEIINNGWKIAYRLNVSQVEKAKDLPITY